MKFSWKGTLLLALVLAGGLAVAGISLSRLGAEPEGDDSASLPAAVEDSAGVAAAAEPPGGPSSIEATPPVVVPTPEYSFTQAEAGKRTIVIDPGHGGPWDVGAVHRNAYGGVDVVEKGVNLRIALKLRDLLEEANYRVVLTRDADRGTLEVESDEPGNRRIRADLQARVNTANEARADLFISIHNNGSTSPGESGTEVWYSKDRPFAAQNLALARLIQENLVKQIRAVGHDVRDRGVKDDSSFRIWQGRRFNLFVLGPPRNEPSSKTATLMPGALGESLFVTNAAEAALLRQERTLEAIARGYFDAIQGYFGMIDSGELAPPPPPEEVAAERPVSPVSVIGYLLPR